jgi:hypothetical protein
LLGGGVGVGGGTVCLALPVEKEGLGTQGPTAVRSSGSLEGMRQMHFNCKSFSLFTTRGCRCHGCHVDAPRASLGPGARASCDMQTGWAAPPCFYSSAPWVGGGNCCPWKAACACYYYARKPALGAFCMWVMCIFASIVLHTGSSAPPSLPIARRFGFGLPLPS